MPQCWWLQYCLAVPGTACTALGQTRVTHRRLQIPRKRTLRSRQEFRCKSDASNDGQLAFEQKT